MKVTEELEEAFTDAAYDTGEQVTASTYIGLEKVMEMVNAEIRTAIEKVKALDTGGNYKAAYIRGTVEDILRELAA